MHGAQLSPLDVAFLCLESRTTPMHMGAVAVFGAHGQVDPERLLALLTARAVRIPRLRVRVRHSRSPLGGANWEDDPGFDPARHMETHRLSTLYEEDPLAAHAARWLAPPLDLHRPLWRLQVVTGLPDGSFALLLKLHHALTDGTGAVTVALGLLDEVPALGRTPAQTPGPVKRKSFVDSLLENPLSHASATVGKAAESAGIAGSVLLAARPYPVSPIATANSTSRELGFATLDTADVRRVRAAHGGTTNDVVLAVLAGALRTWLRNRGRRPENGPLRALVPVSVRAREAEGKGGNLLSGYLSDLPVELDDPVERLRAVRRSMDRNKAAGPVRGAGALPVLAGRVPAGMHKLAARFAGQAAPLLFDTVVTNVPLPGIPLTLDGAKLRRVYPFVPLAPHHSVGVAVSSYRKSIHIGLQANGDAVADLGSLTDAIGKSLAELLNTCP
ncbi:acyltransferase, WS/DGAT/MGAT [Amycolatopsis marina]|uniref:Diacylglycerol O-acyltransferase n=1 Tax=Amycolatopsis marina TaxID=490629 RepID=A0A1I1AGT4_9PSEU|nr:wax ester/triacylglycerol synthase family O-acyltransferase [Amycolatopsis marina]SFB37214.1 acyltransferase, WS/DGAT/MGAT [Amycolatopsis marina]